MTNKLIQLMFMILFLTSCNLIHGLTESEFVLSPESTLPAWYPSIPEGYKRNDITIRITTYTTLLPVNNTVFVVEDSQGKTLFESSGNSENHPKYWAWAHRDLPARNIPHYSYLTIDGKKEIIEQKEENNLLYISTEDAVKRLLGKEY